MPDTRVLIVAHPSLAQLLQRTVSTAEPGGDIHVTGVAATAAEAIALMAAEPPDILLIDLSENSAGGLQTVQTLREYNPRVIMLAHVHTIVEDLILQAIRLGVTGFVSVQEEIVGAIQTLQQGIPYLPPLAARQFVLKFAARKNSGSLGIAVMIAAKYNSESREQRIERQKIRLIPHSL